MSAATRYLVALSAFVNRIAMWGAVAAVTVMVASASWQVFARYLLASPPVWTEELARHAMVWAGMLGASCAFRAMADPTLFPGARDTQGRVGMALALIRAAGVVLLATPVIWYSFIGPRGGFARGFLARSAERDAEMIDLSMVWFTSAIPAAFILIVIHMLADLATRATALNRGDNP